MKKYRLFIKINIEQNYNNYKLALVLLGLLGFFWISKRTQNSLEKNLFSVDSRRIFRNSNIGYIGIDTKFTALKVEKNDSYLFYWTEEEFLEENNPLNLVIDLEELFTFFKNAIMKNKYHFPLFPSRIDILNNPCITIDKDCEIVFKQNDINISSIDPEVENIPSVDNLNEVVNKSSYSQLIDSQNLFLNLVRIHFYNLQVLRA